ncbi:Acyl-CoA dehydrogenase [Pelagimonas phthalicica]|uniref:Acyl-CoA dehydrogenase n=1 Tax=Pelagimonas phthalicica TaxID=1037362 RepID=A0A238JKW6_9RHOB|nr:acyl-CoA dehydrogenase family protein [Pelagimonas phthalicica]TDS87213.1 alkylation response protein AidB-like acyl-CoA dehydrogenase [Pelagimonas phthalicica]SMX30572.1 Acyl-CoA dehydrogenase [Pelagimonas phthalicica]
MFKTEEQTMACDMLRRFLDDQIEPEYLKVKDAPFEKKVIQGFLTQLSEFGLTSAPHPEEAGGMGLDWSTHLMLFEEVGVTAMDIAVPILINVVGADLLLRLGTDEQRARYIPQLLAGETSVAIGISEPGVGSDVAAVKTRARKDGGDWVISGEKTWISNGRFADFLICTCNTGEGLTHILVDRKEQGFETRDIPKIGLNAQSTSQVFLDEVRVPVENTIGAEGRGLQQTLVVFERARVHMAMWGIALARRALEESIRYAQERNQHGKQIAGHQMIADKIATMATEIDAARLLTHRAAGMIDRDERCDTECAMAKWYGTEIAVNATRQAVQIHGGNGVTREFIVERLAREAIIGPIPDGTTEIQKLLIARSLTGVAAFK